MEIINEKLADYVQQHSEPESDLLSRINRETHIEVLQPRMLSGHLQGRVLSMFSKLIRPLNVLEIGTYTGYSAICLAEGLQEKGKLTTIEVNKELEEKIKAYVNESSYGKQIELLIGDALEIIPTLSSAFDLIFIDADKTNYLNYYNLVIDRIPSGAIIIADNVLWSGKVVEPLETNDLDTKSLVEFNRYVQNDTRVENVLFPIRDGLMIIRKI